MSDLKDQRTAVGLTQHELAERMGVSQPLVAQWETGKRSPNAAQSALLSGILAGDDSETQHAGASPTRRARDQYPAAPSDPERRRAWVDARNAQIRAGRRETFNPSGTEGKGIPRVEKKKREK